MVVPSGSAVTADFRCSTLLTGTAMTVYAQRLADPPEGGDTGGVGAQGTADVDRGADLQHVATVQRAGA